MLLHLLAGSKEDAESAAAFFEVMKRRGLNDALPVTADGAPRDHQRDRDLLSAGGPSTLPGASPAQPGGRGAGERLAAVQGAGTGGLSGAEPSDCASLRPASLPTAAASAASPFDFPLRGSID